MKFVIKHEIKGRIRAHAVQYRMTFEQADRMQYYLDSQDMITSAKVQNRTGDFTICFKGDREKVISLLQSFHDEEVGIVPCVFNGIPDVQLVCLEKYRLI